MQAINSIYLPFRYLAERKKEFGKDYSGKTLQVWSKIFENLFQPGALSRNQLKLALLQLN